jgi:N-dimethylarginine dimethylaminohydrolase
MNKIVIVDLPRINGKIRGCWYNGYPIHKGHTESSLNYATLYANQKNIIPDQKRLKRDFKNFKKTLKQAGFDIRVLSFPEEINKTNNLHHDAVFVRDAGLIFKDYWIKANFSATVRQAEAEVHTKTITKKFGKKIIELPKDAFLEFGEVFLLQTKNGTYYFGGLSRSNEAGHNFAKSIIKPDNFCLIRSNGYHLDTVFSPVLNKDNELVAFIVAKNMLDSESLESLKKFNLEIIYVDPIDSSGEGEELGNYAVNTLIAPGIMLNCAKFLTMSVEEKLKKLGIKRFVSPLTDFRFAGGSYHCLTNEIYE